MRQLEAFVTVYREGSLTKAAEKLYLTQSTVSVLIRQLEVSAGVRLFDRTTRSLAPTRVAREMIEPAERVLRDLDACGDLLRAFADRSRGTIDFAVTPSFGAAVMPVVLAIFAARYPRIEVRMRDVALHEIRANVLDGEVEFGIAAPEQGAGLEVQTILTYAPVLVCRKDSPVARRKQLAWRDVIEYPTIIVPPMRAWIEQTLADVGKAYKPAWEVSLFATALAMTKQNLGLAILPSYLAEHYAAEELATIELVAPSTTRDLVLLKRREATLSTAADALVEIVRSHVRTTASEESH
ncbi:MAG TPA: LysR substrate-binding domain-containing protein [Candidatus Limnocylindria bacterium]|nr:LysR substrate-binding domain-containing protein [Candidatus Limnocylindria bacterium]